LQFRNPTRRELRRHGLYKTVDTHAYVDLGLRIIVTCSLIHTFAPPWDIEALQPFPRLKNYYRLFIYVVGYIALNGRSTIYRSISTENPNGPNANAVTLQNGNGKDVSK
jgi:hypothetical protein